MSDVSEKQQSGPTASDGIGETVRTVLYALAIALLVRTFAFEPFSIPSGSMKSTLLVGDYLFVSKYSYGYSRYSFPMSLAPFSGRIFLDVPERGDVLVFRLPTDPSIDYIKRVVGLPGDTIQVIRGVLHINGKAVERERIDDFVERGRSGNVSRTPRYVETLPNGVRHVILESKGDNGWADDTPVFTVPEDHLFMMGDNRDNSNDSRVMSEVGYVPFENIVGKARWIWFSIDGDMWKVWEWPAHARPDRIGNVIE